VFLSNPTPLLGLLDLKSLHLYANDFIGLVVDFHSKAGKADHRPRRFVLAIPRQVIAKHFLEWNKVSSLEKREE
jgi:hypothetical protein